MHYRMETSFPKAFHKEIEYIVSKEQARKLVAFVLLPVIKTVKPALKSKLYGSLSAILAMPSDCVRNLCRYLRENPLHSTL